MLRSISKQRTVRGNGVSPGYFTGGVSHTCLAVSWHEVVTYVFAAQTITRVRMSAAIT